MLLKKKKRLFMLHFVCVYFKIKFSKYSIAVFSFRTLCKYILDALQDSNLKKIFQRNVQRTSNYQLPIMMTNT